MGFRFGDAPGRRGPQWKFRNDVRGGQRVCKVDALKDLEGSHEATGAALVLISYA